MYLPRCLESLSQYADYPFCQRVIVEDPEHQWTASGAVNEAWSQVDADYLLHVEEDFLLTEPVDFEAMARVLDANENLAHLVLKRQPWNGDEVAAGGIIEQRPHDYIDREHYVEHRNFFSLNPGLVPRRVFSQGFPEGSEPAITQRLLEQGYHFGYWGKRSDPPRCLHIGEHRSVGSVR